MTWGPTRCRQDGSYLASHKRQWARSPSLESASRGSDHRLRLAARWSAGCRGRTTNSTWAGLTEILKLAKAKRLIVIGDFNQTIGQRSRARPELRLALRKAFPPSMRIAMSDLAFQARRSIDHIALSADWAVSYLGVISNIHEGRKLSDHFGVVADLSVQPFQ